MKAAFAGFLFETPILVFATVVVVLSGCERPTRIAVPGYVEGEYVYVAAPVAGRLTALHVHRGQLAKPGEPLFELEPEPENTRLAEATSKVQRAQAMLADLQKGRRPSEIASLRAQLAEAEAGFALASAERQRQVNLADNQAASQQERERAEATARQAMERVVRLRADLETAETGARTDQIAAAEAEVKTLEAVQARARWELEQKHPVAIQQAPIHDTLYRVGEWVPAGKPVVVLLPPDHIKIRVYVSEARLARLQIGDHATVNLDGVPAATETTVAFIATRAEYTPPVLYSRDNRTRLVYLVELSLPSAEAARFHPGQPVDVTFSNR